MSVDIANDKKAQPIDPARLAAGQWCNRTGKTVSEGDIHASYSADRIGMGPPLRKPFTWRGGLCVCVGIARRGEGVSAEAYRLVHPSMFDGVPLTYADKTADGDAARADPNGFYHGMRVKHAGTDFVLSGPPAIFVPGKTEQLELF